MKQKSEWFYLIMAGPFMTAGLAIVGPLGEWIGFAALIMLSFHLEGRRSFVILVSWLVSSFIIDMILWTPKYGHMIYWFLQ